VPPLVVVVHGPAQVHKIEIDVAADRAEPIRAAEVRLADCATRADRTRRSKADAMPPAGWKSGKRLPFGGAAG